MGNISFSSVRSDCPPHHFSLFLWLLYSMWVQLWVYVRTENMQQTHCFLKELGLLQLHFTGKLFARFKLPLEQLMQPVPSCSFISRAAERKGTSCVNLLNHVRKASCCQPPSFWIADISPSCWGKVLQYHWKTIAERGLFSQEQFICPEPSSHVVSWRGQLGAGHKTWQIELVLQK